MLNLQTLTREAFGMQAPPAKHIPTAADASSPQCAKNLRLATAVPPGLPAVIELANRPESQLQPSISEPAVIDGVSQDLGQIMAAPAQTLPRRSPALPATASTATSTTTTLPVSLLSAIISTWLNHRCWASAW